MAVDTDSLRLARVRLVASTARGRVTLEEALPHEFDNCEDCRLVLSELRRALPRRLRKWCYHGQIRGRCGPCQEIDAQCAARYERYRASRERST